MRMISLCKTLLVSAALALVGMTAADTFAQAPPQARDDAKSKRDDAKAKRDDAKAARDDAKAARDEARDAREAARDAGVKPGDDPGVVAARDKARKAAKDLVEARKDLAKARKEARQAEREAIKARLKTAKGNVNKAALRAELEMHSRRLARLARAHELAQEAKDEEAIARIDRLIAQENDRHGRWLDRHTAPTPGGAK